MKNAGYITTNVKEAARILNGGGVIGMPTETVYGLAARADLEESVGRIFDIKGRPRNHPLIAHLSPDADASHWGEFNESAERLAELFWPGPLTLLVPRTQHIGVWVTGGRDSVALRVPAHTVTQQLLREVDDAVVAPSANRFGKVSPTTAEHVAHDLGNTVDCILDGGQCSIGVESTIVECVGESISILRPGGISAQQISQATGLTVSLVNGESRAPGMLLSHYAPNAELIIVSSSDEAQSIAMSRGLTNQQWHLMSFYDSEEYAMNMYHVLRQCDLRGETVVFAIKPREDALGVAVLDRLLKASAPRI